MADAGEAPNVARLMAMGTTFGHGAVASLPTVTLANHTAILTGAHPGHHEILHNAWYDRAGGRQVITNSPATWATAMRWLGSGVDTIHSAVPRTWAVDRAGAMDSTAFFLVADHGMEETNPEVRGDWGDALRAAGIGFRDEAFGFIYLV